MNPNKEAAVVAIIVVVRSVGIRVASMAETERSPYIRVEVVVLNVEGFAQVIRSTGPCINEGVATRVIAILVAVEIDGTAYRKIVLCVDFNRNAERSMANGVIDRLSAGPRVEDGL